MVALDDVPASPTSPTPGYGRRIRHARLAVNKTRHELADAVGITAGSVLRYELERMAPSEKNLIRIAKVTRVTAAYLMFGQALLS